MREKPKRDFAVPANVGKCFEGCFVYHSKHVGERSMLGFPSPRKSMSASVPLPWSCYPHCSVHGLLSGPSVGYGPLGRIWPCSVVVACNYAGSVCLALCGLRGDGFAG